MVRSVQPFGATVRAGVEAQLGRVQAACTQMMESKRLRQLLQVHPLTQPLWPLRTLHGAAAPLPSVSLSHVVLPPPSGPDRPQDWERAALSRSTLRWSSRRPAEARVRFPAVGFAPTEGACLSSHIFVLFFLFLLLLHGVDDDDHAVDAEPRSRRCHVDDAMSTMLATAGHPSPGRQDDATRVHRAGGATQGGAA